MAMKSRALTSFVMFDVEYENGTRISNRKVSASVLAGLDGDEPARGIVEFAARLGVDRKVLHRSEIGTAALPDECLARLCDISGYPMAFFDGPSPEYPNHGVSYNRARIRARALPARSLDGLDEETRRSLAAWNALSRVAEQLNLPEKELNDLLFGIAVPNGPPIARGTPLRAVS